MTDKQYTPQQLKSISIYAIETPNSTRTSNETGIFRSVLSPNELVKDYPNYKTVVDLFEMGLDASPNGPCLGHRPCIYDSVSGLPVKWLGYQWQTYSQISKRRLDFGRGLQYAHNSILSLSPNDKWHLGIYSTNRPEWVIADFGAHVFSNATVALYDTLGPEACEFIINHADIPIIVTTLDKVPNILKISGKCPKLKAIIVMDDNFPSVSSSLIAPLKLYKQWAGEKGLLVYRFSEIEEFGIKNPIPLRLPKADDVFCICYTSGTTGNPKGALLTHGNMVSVQKAGDLQLALTLNDVHISYLPLAHVFERVILLDVLAKGACAGFFRGDVALLVEDIQVLRPTLFPSVPRLLNRIYDKIMNQAMSAGGLKKTLFERAIQGKLEGLKNGHLTHVLWDKLVFAKVKAVLGGRVRFMITASAPISASTLSFLRIAFGCEVLEAYGQTECTGGFTMTLQGDYSVGHVGSVLTCSELKLVSVPDMKYMADENKGEIWARGPNVFKGYYKDEAKTAETITSDGWLKTGDIGSIDAKGRLSIIDRKKNIFKLAQGEYVAPDKIENTYVKSNFIAQLYVHGDSLQSELVAIVVPDPEFCIQWGKDKGYLPLNAPPGITPPPPGQPPHPGMIKLCQLKEFKDAILKDMDRLGKVDALRGFEFVKIIHLDPNFFSIENGLLTPTFKLKRNEAAIYYRPIIDDLYKSLLSTVTPKKVVSSKL